MPKNINTIIRLNEQENNSLSYKAKILGINKSELLRKSALSYFPKNNINSLSRQLLEEYKVADLETKNIIVDMLVEYYSLTGYPHNKLSNNQKMNEMKKIASSKSPLLDDNHLQTNTIGLALCNYYHPHMVKVKCGKYRTPYEQYENKDLLKDAIRRWLNLGNIPKPSGIRRILRTRDGVRSVVNFKPVIAKFIYDNYCPVNGRVLDPCSGFSGRLAGCISSNKNLFYHGIDPMGETAIGNMKMASFFSKQYDMFGRIWKFGFRFDMGCAEEIMPTLKDNEYNIIYSSPPYWKTEEYSQEPTQSFKKFPEYEKWREGFLKVIIVESKRLLKENGFLIINIKNYKKIKIADDTIKFAEECGLKLKTVYDMMMAKNEYNRSNKNSPEHATAINWHTEPIFVFQ